MIKKLYNQLSLSKIKGDVKSIDKLSNELSKQKPGDVEELKILASHHFSEKNYLSASNLIYDNNVHYFDEKMSSLLLTSLREIGDYKHALSVSSDLIEKVNSYWAMFHNIEINSLLDRNYALSENMPEDLLKVYRKSHEDFINNLLDYEDNPSVRFLNKLINKAELNLEILHSLKESRVRHTENAFDHYSSEIQKFQKKISKMYYLKQLRN